MCLLSFLDTWPILLRYRPFEGPSREDKESGEGLLCPAPREGNRFEKAVTPPLLLALAGSTVRGAPHAYFASYSLRRSARAKRLRFFEKIFDDLPNFFKFRQNTAPGTAPPFYVYIITYRSPFRKTVRGMKTAKNLVEISYRTTVFSKSVPARAKNGSFAAVNAAKDPFIHHFLQIFYIMLQYSY